MLLPLWFLACDAMLHVFAHDTCWCLGQQACVCACEMCCTCYVMWHGPGHACLWWACACLCMTRCPVFAYGLLLPSVLQDPM